MPQAWSARRNNCLLVGFSWTGCIGQLGCFGQSLIHRHAWHGAAWKKGASRIQFYDWLCFPGLTAFDISLVLVTRAKFLVPKKKQTSCQREYSKNKPFGRTNPQKRNFVIRCCPWIHKNGGVRRGLLVLSVLSLNAALLSVSCVRRGLCEDYIEKKLEAKQHFSNSSLTALSLHTSLLSVRHRRRGLLALSLEASLKSFLVVFGPQASYIVCKGNKLFRLKPWNVPGWLGLLSQAVSAWNILHRLVRSGGMPNPMESGWAPMLCIDCGGVLTKYGTFKYEGEDIYKATIEGAWAFLLLWQAAYGEDAVNIISKVNWFTRKEKPFHSARLQNSNATPKPKPKPKGKPKPKSKGKAQAKGKAKGQKRKAAEMDQEDAAAAKTRMPTRTKTSRSRKKKTFGIHWMTAKKTLADTAKISKSLADAARSSVMADTAMGCRNFDSLRAGVKRFPTCASLQQLPHACKHAHTQTTITRKNQKGQIWDFRSRVWTKAKYCNITICQSSCWPC